MGEHEAPEQTDDNTAGVEEVAVSEQKGDNDRDDCNPPADSAEDVTPATEGDSNE